MRPEAERKIVERVQALGFASLGDYLAARVGVPYTDLADELGSGVLGLHIAALQMKHAANPRAAAADALVRALRQVLTKGWDLTDAAEPGVSPEFVNITAWSYWTSLLEGVRPEEEILDRLWDTLRRGAKPGWLPRTADDPVLKNAFDQAWPTQ